MLINYLSLNIMINKYNCAFKQVTFTNGLVYKSKEY